MDAPAGGVVPRVFLCSEWDGERDQGLPAGSRGAVRPRAPPGRPAGSPARCAVAAAVDGPVGPGRGMARACKGSQGGAEGLGWQATQTAARPECPQKVSEFDMLLLIAQ
eukprot:scaffold177577_cov34-Prasinocladus_malaysianus.AAC.1